MRHAPLAAGATLLVENVEMNQSPPKLTHDWIWHAIDALAASKDLTPSALAKLASLDPTTFNKSKRFTPEGRPRWPSTESISKVLQATGTSLDEFAELTAVPMSVNSAKSPPQLEVVPIIGEIRSAEVSDLHDLPNALSDEYGPQDATRKAEFALAVADRSLEPVYSQGNTLVLKLNNAPKVGDRVVVKPSGSNAVPRFVVGAERASLEFAAIGAGKRRDYLQRTSIDWIARIVWARQ